LQVKIVLDDKGVKDRLNKISKLSRLEVKKIIDDTLNHLRVETIANITRSGIFETGNLRNSIKITNRHNNGEIRILAEYGIYVEYGTGIYSEVGGRNSPWAYFNPNTGSYVTTSGMPPRPYFRPAVETGRVFLANRLEGVELI
jgi:hypothetical protein